MSHCLGHLSRAVSNRVYKLWKRKVLGSTNEDTRLQQETTKFATGSLVAEELGSLAHQVKPWRSMESYASNSSVSMRWKEDERAHEMLKATTKLDAERYKLWQELEKYKFSSNSDFGKRPPQF